MENSKIEWCDHTFNPWIGCTKVSQGCANCYAENLMDKIWNKVQWGKGKERKLTSEANWKLPLKWDTQAAKEGVRKKVFCASLSDVFDKEVSDKWRVDLFTDLIFKTPNLDWLLLTKRPDNALRFMTWLRGAFYPHFPGQDNPNDNRPLENVSIGTSVENQKAVDERIPILAKIPAKKRFLSCEPLLEKVDLKLEEFGRHPDYDWGIDWVIVGGESGNNARPMHPNWVRSIRDQCQDYGVKFLFKQWGEYSYEYFSDELHENIPLNLQSNNPKKFFMGKSLHEIQFGGSDSVVYAQKVGKNKSGRLLDEREWNEKP